MKLIDQLFDRMDAWRHLPNYQLERRADLFFSLYLPRVLEAKLGFPVRTALVPELPVRIGTIYPRIPINKSFKIDYLALSTDGAEAVFVELKTEESSRRPKQDSYLAAARDVGLVRLLEGLLDIFGATSAKRKYFCLFERLAGMDLLEIPVAFREIMTRPNLQGANEASRSIRVTARVTRHRIVYVQPNGSGDDIVSFHDFRAIVEQYDDPVSQRFAKSLAEWACVQAGRTAST
ncbi:MAG TPA: hypothetical protein VMZ31_04905 [Phycisphaerae bacterium]|nr:hypothetical protein [Phycisphaerae bacterium]